MSEQQRQGEKATITRHSAVGYGFSLEVREFKVHDPEPYAQYSVSVSIEYKMPRKRKRQWMRAVPEDISFITIDVDGQTVYDSRSDVPCDMDEYQAVADRRGQPLVVHQTSETSHDRPGRTEPRETAHTHGVSRLASQ